MKRLSWPVVAMAVLLAAAFCVQATSTWKLGERRNLEGIALPALVVLLEVGSVTSSAIFFAAKTRGVRVRALLMLLASAILGGAGGVIAYGWIIGVFVAVALLGLVEVIGAYRHEKPTEQSTGAKPASPSIEQPAPVEAKPVEPRPSPAVDTPVDEQSIDVPVDPPTQPIDIPVYQRPIEPPAKPYPWDRHDDEPHATVSSAASAGKTVTAVPEPEPEPEPEPSHYSDHLREGGEPPSVEDRARALVIEAQARGERLGEGRLNRLLTDEGYSVTRYQCKKFLGNKTTSRSAAELEEVAS